ncbi:MAG TPA: hypothetical protein VMB18_15100 [Terriglobales bacterium]|nr:hypothetical protein [Terriglobales bacterium]
MEYDIADVLEIRDLAKFLTVMQEIFEGQIGSQKTFRITATPTELGEVNADLANTALRDLLEDPPGRQGGWNAKPLRPLRRNSLGFENDRPDFHHLKFIKNGHLEFWTAIDDHFSWRQKAAEQKVHPLLYPYAVVEYPVSFLRLYRRLVELLGAKSEYVFQMEYLNVQGAILRPYQPESIGYDHSIDEIMPLARSRLVFQKKRFGNDFDPDPAALELIKDLYFEFGYEQNQIPFFDATGHCKL